MTPRSLIILILRVLGIILLRGLIISITEFASFIWMFFSYGPSEGLYSIFISLLNIAVILLLGYWLIFKTAILVDKFGLDKGFTEESFQLNISAQSILRMAIIITGAIVLFWEIPQLITNIYNIWQQYDLGILNRGSINWGPLIWCIIRIILALLIIGERKRIIEFLVKEPGNKNEQGTEPVQ